MDELKWVQVLFPQNRTRLGALLRFPIVCSVQASGGSTVLQFGR